MKNKYIKSYWDYVAENYEVVPGFWSKHNKQIDEFTTAYIYAALETCNDDDGSPLIKNYDIRDIGEESLKKMIDDCKKFQEENAEYLATKSPDDGGSDFWLTRNSHGAGFWDGDWPDEAGQALDASSKKYGECDLVIGDDGMLYLE